jgi:dihydrofolate synthase/folylpolyglutamate synthase
VGITHLIQATRSPDVETLDATVAARGKAELAMDKLREKFGRDAIERGLTEARWPARLELLDAGGGRSILLDAAHNVEGAGALASYLARWHPERPPLVIGVMADKDVDGILRLLLPVASAIVTTAAASRRAMPAAALAARVTAIDPGRDVVAVDGAASAVGCAFAHANLICVAGSIYLAGEVRDAVQRRAILH